MSILALLLCGAAGLHPNSLSTSRVLVEGSEVSVSVRCQALSLFEVVPRVDADENGIFEASELAASVSELRTYFAEHYGVSSADERLAIAGFEARMAPGDPSAIFDRELVDVELRFVAPDRMSELVLDVDMFLLTSPDHRDLCQIVWNGKEPLFTQFDTNARQWRGPPADPNAPAPGSNVFVHFLRMGADHILSGYDHLAFLAALFLSTRGLRALVGVVTAFTLAHSVTLGIAAMTEVDLPSRMIETVIALSIAYVAADNLMRPMARSRWPEAFVFGLVHGLGFAGFLGQSLLAAPSQTSALIGFNLGVEAGQLVVVLALALAFALIPRNPGPLEEGEVPFLAPAWTRRAGNMVLVVLGLYWFAERAWFS